MKARLSVGIAGALIALALSLMAFAGTRPAVATQGQALVAGVENSETGPTGVYNTSAGFTGCTAGGGFAAGFVACGNIGVQGRGTTANGISGTGVSGDGSVYGVTGSGGSYGVYGGGGTGVYGEGTENGVQAVGGTFGVFAEGDDYGLYARAPLHGVFGQATSSSGSGVEAMSTGGGIALKVSGKAQLSRSGVATVAGTSSAPKNSVRVTIGITAKSMMFAILQKFVSGVFVIGAVPNVAGGYFTIYLNKSVTTSVGPIAWMVTERP
jgi:hypothetical protein